MRQAWRSLLRRPAFAVAVTLTLAAGTGITTALFTLVDTVLIKPLPFPEAGRLVSVMESSPTKRDRASLIAPVRLEEWNRLARLFTAISGSYSENVTDTSGPEPERLQGRRVAPRFFDVYGTPPLRGRTFVPDEERFGGTPAAIISDGYWARRFARADAAIGGRLTIAGRGVTIVGVMPRTFAPSGIDVWLPAQLSPYIMQAREARFYSGVGRLRSGVSIDEARADLAAVQRVLGEQFPRTDKDWSADIRSLKDVRVGDYRRALTLVLGAESLLFLIALANVAGLMLVQLRRRSGELAIRAAIGASPADVLMVVTRETLILVTLGAIGGLALAAALIGLMRATLTAVPRIAEMSLDARAVSCAIGLSALAAFACGVMPAWVASRRHHASLLAGAGRRLASGAHPLQGALVVAQIALSVLLAGSGALLLRSYGALRGVDPGFNAAQVITFHVGAAWDEDRARLGALQQQLVERLHQLPGVRAAGYTNFLPAAGATLRFQVYVDSIAGPEADGSITVGSRTVTPGYLRALQVPLVAGTWCSELRADPSPLTAMVNRRFAEVYGSGAPIVGRNLGFSKTSRPFQIVGVVGDLVEDGPAAAPAPYVYACMRAGSWPDPEYVLRVDGETRAVAAGVRALVHELDPKRPVFGIRPLDEVIDAAFDQSRLNATIVSTFAIGAVSLAGLGLYGLLMLLVADRRRELGIRLALGATRGDVMRLVVGGAGRLVGSGLVAGLALFWAAGRLLSTILFGVSPLDPAALGAGALVLSLAVLTAIALPLRRAAGVNAVEAMRD